MYEIFYDALVDSANTIPFLLIIYIAIELIEYKFGDRIKTTVQKAGSSGPFFGALSGSFPQCGFSVIATALYTQRLATIGTLLAVYLSTSDEAIPIILSQPEKAHIVIPIILTKIIIAIIAGYSIDWFMRKSQKKTLKHIDNYAKGVDDEKHHHEEKTNKKACCGHDLDHKTKKLSIKEIFFHPLIHTLKIFGFIFIATAILNSIIFMVGQDNIENALASVKILQPVFTAIIGLIPNCAASVVITELYLKGAITYGAVISGLCASGGLGLLILTKEEKNKNNVLMIISLLLLISIIAGLVIQAFSII